MAPVCVVIASVLAALCLAAFRTSRTLAHDIRYLRRRGLPCRYRYLVAMLGVCGVCGVGCVWLLALVV